MPNTYDPSRGITYFQAMIGQGNYFNTRPRIRRRVFRAPDLPIAYMGVGKAQMNPLLMTTFMESIV